MNDVNFLISKKSLYPVLYKIIGVLSGRPRLNILSYILLEVVENKLVITITDLEIEIIAQILLDDTYPIGASTVPGRKFFSIFRSFSESAIISITSKHNKLIVCSGTSKFFLATLPISDFPKLEKWNNIKILVISQSILKNMIELIYFSMGNQDVRYYLNGICFEIEKNILRLVATDGHRLAMCETYVEMSSYEKKIIIPRKGIMEILRLLSISTECVQLQLNYNNVRIIVNNYIFTSKLIDAKFPNYHGVLLNKVKDILEVSCIHLQNTLKRVSILSNEKIRVVTFHLITNRLKITANNFNNESSEEILDVIYSGQDMTISFNVDYILDILNVIGNQGVRFFLTNDLSGVKIEGSNKKYEEMYFVMPIRI